MNTSETKATGNAKEGRAKKLKPPAAVAVYGDDALLDAPMCAAGGRIGLSLWHELVKKGKAPQPAIRSHKFTRWKAGDVIAFWRAVAQRGSF